MIPYRTAGAHPTFSPTERRSERPCIPDSTDANPLEGVSKSRPYCPTPPPDEGPERAEGPCAVKSAISSAARLDLLSLGGAARLVTVSVGKLSIQASRAAVAARSSALLSARVVELPFGDGFWPASEPGLRGTGRGGSALPSSDFDSPDLGSSEFEDSPSTAGPASRAARGAARLAPA